MEDVGVPKDGVWPQEAAYDRKYCRRHRTYEYLLGTLDRWMRPSDFDDLGDNKLDAMLEAHRTQSSEFKPHLKSHQASCNTSLSKQIFSVIGKATIGDEVFFLIKWKAYWTPKELVINTDGWADKSLQSHREGLNE